MLPRAIFFDFDGTLVDSNRIKREAFYWVTQDIRGSHEFIAQLLEKDESLSRYEVLRELCARFSHEIKPPLNYEQLISRYSKRIVKKVTDAPEISGATHLLAMLKATKSLAFVCSGTPSEDLQKIVQHRGWLAYFSALRGAPKTKAENIEELRESYGLKRADCCVIGDRSDDMRAARQCRLKFLAVGKKFEGSNDAFNGLTVVRDMHHAYEIMLKNEFDKP